MKNILQVNQVGKTFGPKNNQFKALSNINFTVNEGEFIGIMGPSGAGKSTLLNVLSTIDSPTTGEIFIDDENVVQMREKKLANFRRNKLGFIFQDYNLLDTLTVKENIVLPLALAGVPAAEIDTRVKKVASKLNIYEIFHQFPYQISGGQKQRTAAARAIVTNPSVIFADEPTGALDSKSAADLLKSLQMLNSTQKSTIMMVTHDAYAASFCKRVVFMKDGELSTELHIGEQSQKDFFQEILGIVSAYGGEENDTI